MVKQWIARSVKIQPALHQVERKDLLSEMEEDSLTNKNLTCESESSDLKVTHVSLKSGVSVSRPSARPRKTVEVKTVIEKKKSKPAKQSKKEEIKESKMDVVDMDQLYQSDLMKSIQSLDTTTPLSKSHSSFKVLRYAINEVARISALTAPSSAYTDEIIKSHFDNSFFQFWSFVPALEAYHAMDTRIAEGKVELRLKSWVRRMMRRAFNKHMGTH